MQVLDTWTGHTKSVTQVRQRMAVCFCLLSAVCSLLSALCCLLFALCCLLSALCSLLSALCCLLSALCCLRMAVCFCRCGTLHSCVCCAGTLGRPARLRGECIERQDDLPVPPWPSRARAGAKVCVRVFVCLCVCVYLYVIMCARVFLYVHQYVSSGVCVGCHACHACCVSHHHLFLMAGLQGSRAGGQVCGCQFR
jgi:hypothetical protein